MFTRTHAHIHTHTHTHTHTQLHTQLEAISIRTDELQDQLAKLSTELGQMYLLIEL